MTTSQTTSLKSVISREDVRLTPAQLGYFTGRAQSHAHEMVLRLFIKLSEEEGMTKGFLARRLGKRPEQVTRWLGAPGNWTIETLASLLAAMGYEPTFNVRRLNELERPNYYHPAACLPAAYAPPEEEWAGVKNFSSNLRIQGVQNMDQGNKSRDLNP